MNSPYIEIILKVGLSAIVAVASYFLKALIEKLDKANKLLQELSTKVSIHSEKIALLEIEIKKFSDIFKQ